MATNIDKCVDEAECVVNVDINLEDNPKEYYDGSPAGNAWVNAEKFKDLAICPEKCGIARGFSVKCYRPCFSKCVTYMARNE